MPKLQDIQRVLEQEESKPDGLIFTDPEVIKARKRMLVWIGRRLGGVSFLEDIPKYLIGYLCGLATAAMIGFWTEESSWVMFIGGGAAVFIGILAWDKRPSWCLRKK